MKTLLKTFLPLALALIGFSCEQTEDVTVTKGVITFAVDQKDIGSGRVSSADQPSSLIISIVNSKGTIILENKKLQLLQFGQGYITEGVELPVGSLQLTKFLVLDATDKVIYATPIEGSEKAPLVTDALPISFSVTSTSTTPVMPQVLKVADSDVPQLFGYATFGFSIVDASTPVKLKVRVVLKVGEIIYEDVNSLIEVKGFDSQNNLKWTQTFPYTGPNANQVEISTGYHHYSVGVNKWGISDNQVITAESLEKDRADGPTPVTYVLGGAIAARQIASYVSYIQLPNPAGIIIQPEQKVEYEYDLNGKVSRMTESTYSQDQQTFVPSRYSTFTYEGAHVTKIASYLLPANTLYSEDSYTYNGNNVLSIVEKNAATGITSQLNLGYDYVTGAIRADYSFSNGGSFVYEFNYTRRNLVSDVTSRFDGVCSKGSYTYDKNINPFKHLGYVDFSLREFSISNRVTENVEYLACAFPTLIPQSYSYLYDSYGYPVSSTTYYKPNSAGAQAVRYIKYLYR